VTATSDYLAIQVYNQTGASVSSIAFVVNGSGNVGIGIQPSAKLDVGGGIAISGTTVIDSSRNLTSIGTIGCGAITSSAGISGTTGNFSGVITLPSGAGTNQIGPGTGDGASYSTYNVYIKTWYGLAIRDYADTVRIVVDARSGTLDVIGGYRINGTTVIDSSRNLTNIGTIGSGAITCSTVSGTTLTASTSHNTSGSAVYQVSGTTVIDSSRNLTSIGTIGCGAITSSSSITGTEVYTGGYFRNNAANTGIYNQVNGAIMRTNDGGNYGSWIMDGNQANGWNGIRFTNQELNLMMGQTNGTKDCGIHMNGVGWHFYSDSSRNFYSPGNITTNWSDRRLKKEFVPVEDYDEILDGMTAYRFKWNSLGEKIMKNVKDGDSDLSLIAQDVQNVLPGAVRVNLAGRSPDKPDDEVFDYLTIDYNKITPIIVEALKQTRKELKDTRERLEKLEKRRTCFWF
jgi:hypothetical protein